MSPDLIEKPKKKNVESLIDNPKCARIVNGNTVISLTNEQIAAYVALTSRKHGDFNLRVNRNMTIDKALIISRLICEKFPEMSVSIIDESNNGKDPILLVNETEVLGFVH